MNPGKPHQHATRLRAACLLTNGLNPFFVFTALYVLVAYAESAGTLRATLYYVAVEFAAAAFVAGYVFLLRRRRRVGDFWISARRQRLVPALVLLTTFAALLGSLALLGAPGTLVGTTLSMGLASATVAATTLFWKASAHSAVAGHAAAAGLLVLGLPGLLFALVLPAVLWSRVAIEAHTPAQVLAGAGIGAAFAVAFLA
jgi:membrane-associated phospholipid phosphatase